MLGVTQVPVPAASLLRTFREGPDPAAWDHYADCFTTAIAQPVTLADYVTAFYTTPIFRLERIILARFGLPSTDGEARELAVGARRTFAAWRLGDRTDTQLLMCDVAGNTRSWFAVTPTVHDGRAATLLQLGSGIIARVDPATGAPARSLPFRLLGRFHVLYSQVLLAAARNRLKR